jgi:sugar O-acyltransferase, sialic acid O-acetyltransferase NeuD family
LTKPAIVLVGAGGHARSCADVIELQGNYSIAGLLGLPGEVGTKLLDYQVLGTDADIARLAAKHRNAIVTVGQIKSASLRIELFEALLENGWVLPTIVSPRGYVSRHASVGAGTIVMHGATVNAGAVVGRNCIINSHALVEHDVIVGDHCHIATAAAVNSGVRIGAGTFIGSRSAVKQGVRIGERCVIGMGERVHADCDAGTRVVSAVKQL